MTMCPIRPIGEWVVIQPLETESKIANGLLVLPESAKEKPQLGIVMAVGNGSIGKNANRIPLDVATGDCILFSKFAGVSIAVNGTSLILMKARDILGVKANPS